MGRMLDALKRIESREPAAPVPAPEVATEGAEAAARPIAPDTAVTISRAKEPTSSRDAEPLRDSTAMESLLVETERAAAEALGEVEAEPSELAGESDVESLPVSSGNIGDGAESDSTPGTCAERGKLPDPLGDFAQLVLQNLVPERPACFLFTSADSDTLGADLLVPLSLSLTRRLDSDLLLIDTNLRRPALATRLGVETSRGLTDVLTGAAKWRDVVRRTVLPGVALLPAVPFSTPAGPPPDRFNLEHLLAEARECYRLMLIHASSLKHPEVIPIARHCEGVYLLVRLGVTSHRAAGEAVRLLQQAGANLFGCVVVQ